MQSINISLAVAGIMNNPKNNYVLLAGCSEQPNEKFGTYEDIIKPSEKVVFGKSIWNQVKTINFFVYQKKSLSVYGVNG
ncbi:MAG: hypothetical protein OEY78_00440 [Gammaproteobacteria bacterium]|nr:hypothetical protein [Gammaproteobacteria bacterium]